MSAVLDPRHLAAALGGEAHGDRVLAPGPGHSKADRSLSIRISPRAPEGFVVDSFADDDWTLCRDYVRERAGLPNWTGKLDRLSMYSRPPVQSARSAPIESSDPERSAYA